MATLTPALENGVTLAPGTSTPVLQVHAEDVNTDRIKAFLAQPSSLYLESPYFDIETAEGVNFAFLDEVTQAVTATVVIDFGDGEVERYVFGANVARNPDGSYAGVNLHKFLSEVLEIPIVTAMQHDADDNPIARVLTQVRDLPGRARQDCVLGRLRDE